MKQEWRPVKDSPNYEVSNLGRVRTIATQKILAPIIDDKGYVTVSLSLEGLVTKRRVHRLVALAFIPNPQNKPEVNHIDGNKKNNTVGNLEWNTGMENMAHAKKHGLNASGERHGLSKLTEFEADLIRTLYKSGDFTQAELAQKFSIDQSLVSRVVTGERWNK